MFESTRLEVILAITKWLLGQQAAALKSDDDPDLKKYASLQVTTSGQRGDETSSFASFIE